MERIKILFTFDIDPETGETKCIDRQLVEESKPSTKKKATSKKKGDNDPIPKITLEENKYSMNSAAVELMGVEPDDRIDIKMEKQGKSLIPVIGTNESFGTKAGNRLTKAYTVSCRGKANDELSKYGTVFTLSAHPSKDGLFIMTGDKKAPVEDEGDENVNIQDEDLPTDVDLEGLTDDIEETTEMSAFDFNL